MVAKTPDYIIADCGCPQWNTSRKEIANFGAMKHFTISIDKNKRLLPQRETITDYYVQVLATKLSTWEATKQRETLYQINKRYNDSSIVKHMKTQRNEATKRTLSQQQQQQSNYSHTSSKPHISDKRRRSRTATTTATTNTALDNDLDVF